MNRKKFIQSHGATCKNWGWSWSFINESKKIILFGSWDSLSTNQPVLIFDTAWQFNANGRKNNGYGQSLHHIHLIENESYKLQVFQLYLSTERKDKNGQGPAKISGFEAVLHSKKLSRQGDNYYAI